MRANGLNNSMLKESGWITDARCGCAQKGLEWQYADLRSLCAQLLKDDVLVYPIENFARFDQASKLVTLSVALSLYDADIPYGKVKKQDIGVVGASPVGALASNLAYFRDYVAYGRKLGRGNLFIYTLASSPLAEAAIHFGLQGPTFYMRHLEKTEENLLAQAEMMVRNQEAQAMLVVVLDTSSATCHCISGAGA